MPPNMRENPKAFGKRVQDILRGQERMESNISMSIRITLDVNPFLTLKDLEQNLLLRLRGFEELDSFEDIGMGPLTAHRLIRLAFQLPSVRGHRSYIKRTRDRGQYAWKMTRSSSRLPDPTLLSLKPFRSDGSRTCSLLPEGNFIPLWWTISSRTASGMGNNMRWRMAKARRRMKSPIYSRWYVINS